MSKELVKSKQYGPVSMGGYGKPYRPKSEASKADHGENPVVDSTAMEQAKEISRSRGMGEGAARYQYKRLQLAQKMGESMAAGKNSRAGHKMLDRHYENLARVFNVNTYRAMYGLQDNGDDNMNVKFEKRVPHKMEKGDVVCTNDNVIGELQDSYIMGDQTRLVFQDRAFMADSFSNDFSIILQDWGNSPAREKGTEGVSNMGAVSGSKLGDNGKSYGSFVADVAAKHNLRPGDSVHASNQFGNAFFSRNAKGKIGHDVMIPKGAPTNHAATQFNKDRIHGQNSEQFTYNNKDHPFHGTSYTIMRRGKDDKSQSANANSYKKLSPKKQNDLHSQLTDYKSAFSRANANSENILREQVKSKKPDHELIAHHQNMIVKNKAFDNTFKEHTKTETSYSPISKSSSIYPSVKNGKNSLSGDYKNTNELTRRTIEQAPEGKMPSGQGLGGYKTPKQKSGAMKGMSSKTDSFMHGTEGAGAGKDRMQGAFDLKKDYGHLHGRDIKANIFDKKGKLVKEFRNSSDNFRATAVDAVGYMKKKGLDPSTNLVFTHHGNTQVNAGKLSSGKNTAYSEKLKTSSAKNNVGYEGASTSFKKKNQGEVNKQPYGESDLGRKRRDNLSKLSGKRSYVGSQTDKPKASGSGGIVLSGFKGLGVNDVSAARKLMSHTTDENLSQKNKVYSGQNVSIAKKSLGKQAGLVSDKEMKKRQEEQIKDKQSGKVISSLVKKDVVTQDTFEEYGRDYKRFMSKSK